MISMQAAEAATVLGATLQGGDVRFTGCSTDSRRIERGQLFVALIGERFDGHDFVGSAAARGASAALVDHQPEAEGITQIVSGDSRRAMGQLAAHWRGRFSLPLIALTGSNGKTTVKEMITAVLSPQAAVLATRGNLNNDIGVPLTLFGLGDEHRYAVIEMGANHAGEIDFLSRMARPAVALITQCAPAHLEGFGSIEGVARAKGEIFHGLVEGGVAIINADDEYAAYWRGEAAGYRQISFGLGAPADCRATGIQDHGSGSRFTLSLEGESTAVNLPLPGRHNVMNALAAAACCRAVGIGLPAIRSGLEAMAPVEGRLQLRRAAGDARILDDSYNANPASLRAALEVLAGLPGRHWLVLGDMGELGDDAARLHEQAGELARERGVERLLTLGDLSERASRAFGAGAAHYTDMESLLGDLLQGLDTDCTVLVKGSRAMAMDRVVTGLLEEG